MHPKSSLCLTAGEVSQGSSAKRVNPLCGYLTEGSSWPSVLNIYPEPMTTNHEVEDWTVTAKEIDLLDTTPSAGGTGYIDLRKAPVPPQHEETLEDADEESRDPEAVQEVARDVPEIPLDEIQEPPLESEASSRPSNDPASDRAALRAVRSSEFFNMRAEQRKEERGAKEEKRRACKDGSGRIGQSS